MKAWLVGHEYLGYAYVRAETRGKAKRFHPAFDETGMLMRSVRAPWLDGDGPARELDWIGKMCEHPNENSWGCPDCDDFGEVVDMDRMIAAHGGKAA